MVSRLSVCPLVLAGGRSRRMGRDKAQLRLASGQTLLARAESLLRSLRVPGLEFLPPLTSGDRPGGIADRVPDRGPLGGLHAVAHFLQERQVRCDALLVIPVDMPLLQRAQLEALCCAGPESGAGALCFDRFYLPLWLRLDERCRNYLRAAVERPETPPVRALIATLGGCQLRKPLGDWHQNVNTMREFSNLTLP
ncbi:molybdenum cofactor guanylyltransferase [Microbulbifer litoralis]|uniref:molybdenum cofactor guanylyltransferase n=1 Tax=Microbulbifer litoralis TaxID=2933965 RepID=UPI0020298B4B